MIEGSTPWPPESAARYRAAGLWEGRTIAAVVAASASVRRDKVAVVDGERQTTYAQLVALVDRLAVRLKREGLVAGDRVVMQLPNSLEFVVAYLALTRIGAISVLVERSPRDATWGFGVVFSDRALEFLHADDEDLYRILAPHFESWPEIAIVRNDTRVPVAGNGFSSIGRLELLTLLYAYVERLGVPIRFETEARSLDGFADADLVVGANGAFSWIRSENETSFGTSVDWRPNRFIWFGTTKAFNSLTLTFRETALGVFCAHHYRYHPDRSTFLVEVTDATWRRAGFDRTGAAETIATCERVFAAELDGHAILSNHSTWRQCPAVWNERWSFDNVVLIGDAGSRRPPH